MDKESMYQKLVKYRLVGKVARTTKLHRNTVKNILTGATESQYEDVAVTAAELAILNKENQLNDQITDILTQLAA